MTLKHLKNRLYQAECNFCGTKQRFAVFRDDLFYLNRKPNEILSEYHLKAVMGWEVWKSDTVNLPNCACPVCKNLILHKI